MAVKKLDPFLLIGGDLVEQRLAIITLGVNDIEVSREFYSGTLGWTPENHSDSIVFYDLGGYLLALYDHKGLAEDMNAAFDAPLPVYQGFTLAYCTNSTDEVDRLFADLEAKGVTIIKHPQQVFWGGYSGYFKDPDGHAWEVAYNPFRRITKSGRFERVPADR